MLNDQGKCSALLTRKGFFDFVIFRTQCNISYQVAVVCQHEQKVNILFNNAMSDVKVSMLTAFYSLHVFSSCDVGWFMVNNVCINFYHCPNCRHNTAAHVQCVTHGGHLAYYVLNNVTLIKPGNILGKNTDLSLFRSMFLHMDDISLSTRETFRSFVRPTRQKHFAVNGSGLCVAFNLSSQCTDNNVVLSLSYNVIFPFDRYVSDLYIHGSPPVVRIPLCKLIYNLQNCTQVHSWSTDFVLPWSGIYQPIFQMAVDKDFTLCEKSSNQTIILTNCIYLYKSCSDGTCVHDSLVCDSQPHCPYGEDERNCQQICSDQKNSCMSHCHHRDPCSCSPGYFQCFSGGCVPLQKLCDKTSHCIDASDEPQTCVYLRPEQLGKPSLSLDINSYINALIQESLAIQRRCLHHNHGQLLSPCKVSYIMYYNSHQDVCSPSAHSSAIKLLCTLYNVPDASQLFSLDHLHI